MIDFGIGQIISVDPTAADALGNPTPRVNVQSFGDGAILSIPLAAAAWEQTMPIAGLYVLYLRYGRTGNHFSRIVKMWGNSPPTARKGIYALNPGEVFIQGPAGLGFLKIDLEGNISLISGDTTATLEMSSVGFVADAVGFSLTTPGGITLNLGNDGTVLCQRANQDGEVLAAFSMDVNNNIAFQSAGDVSIKATNIFLDGNVFAGPNATDPTTRVAFGNVVTGGPDGTYPFDYVTGAPIIGSTTVMAAA